MFFKRHAAIGVSFLFIRVSAPVLQSGGGRKEKNQRGDKANSWGDDCPDDFEEKPFGVIKVSERC